MNLQALYHEIEILWRQQHFAESTLTPPQMLETLIAFYNQSLRDDRPKRQLLVRRYIRALQLKHALERTLHETQGSNT